MIRRSAAPSLDPRLNEEGDVSLPTDALAPGIFLFRHVPTGCRYRHTDLFALTCP